MQKFKSVVMAGLAALMMMTMLVGTGTAAQTGGVSVGLSVDKAAFAADQGVVIHVTLSNPTNRPIKVLKWYTAVEVEEPLFTVTRDGVAVEFTGPHYKRPAPTGNDYLVLKPGETLNSDVDLAAWYDLSLSGNYVVSYDVGSWNLYSEKGNALKTVDALKSAKLALAIDGRAAAIFADAATASTTFNRCTTSQQNDLTTARAQASTYAANALSYLTGNNQGARYTTWFGTYNSTRYNTATSHYTSISSAMNNAAVNFDCGCKKTYYAYVYPNQPYNIYLCRAFWTAPMTGTDSKAGTLIHEMSHFTVVADTDDWVYGQSGAKSLAISDPNKAVDNADNHEYFAENTPALP